MVGPRLSCYSIGIASLLIACSGGNSTTSVLPKDLHNSVSRALPKVAHIVVIVQENRTLDDLFQGFPGANTQSYGLNSNNQQVPLQSESLTAPYDIVHSHAAFMTEYAHGQMNGFNLATISCRSLCTGDTAYGYVPQLEVQPYWDMASQYALADNMFQSNEGPSYPAHQYLLSGTSTIANGSKLRASENPDPFTNGGCDQHSDSVTLIDTLGKETQAAPTCFDRLSIFDLLDTAGLSWKYYQAFSGPGIWNAVDSIKQIWQKPEFKTNVVWPPSQILTDIANGNLAAVSFVTPTALASDHAGQTDGSGPSWVASVVNAIGTSQYWSSTVVFVTWDDWGGWYDHVAPHRFNAYELGLRVPLIAISPFAKTGYVSHKQHEVGSILKFIEKQFGLPSMGTTDVRADDLSDCFNMLSPTTSRPFRRINARFDASHFLHQPLRAVAPDND